MGYIRDIKVSEGDVVKKGQVLLHIDPTEIQASLSEAQARVSQAKARLKEADNDLARYLALFEKGLIALSRYQKAELSQQLASVHPPILGVATKQLPALTSGSVQALCSGASGSGGSTLPERMVMLTTASRSSANDSVPLKPPSSCTP